MDSLVKAGAVIAHRDQLPASSRYELLVRIASGGMATVYVGRKSGAVGFWRMVAIKRAHAHLLEEAAFGRMLIAEARLAARIHHPNVVAVQDVEELEGELLLIMDYVEGASLSALAASALERDTPLPTSVAVRITLDACAGLHAAHELTDEEGELLKLVHRDVSPQNIIVGIDGVTRIADFGIAKCARGATAGTATGALKGKVGYMAPEYVETGELDARGDVWALGVVLWETLARRRLFRGQTELETLRAVLAYDVAPPSKVAPWVPPVLDAVVLRALARSPSDRFSSARAFGAALEEAAHAARLVASHVEVGECVTAIASSALETRRELVRQRLAVDPSGVRTARPAKAVPDDDIPVIEATGFRTVTLPQPPAPSVASEHAPSAAASQEPDASTLASGISRPTLATRATRRRARTAALWMIPIAVACAVGWAGIHGARRAAETDAPAAAASSAAALITPEDHEKPAAPSPPADSATNREPLGDPARASASSARTAEGAPPPRSPSSEPAHARPRSRPRTPSPPPASPSPSATAERAPPNPYAR